MLRFLPCLYAFIACASFCYIFQVRKPRFIFLCSLNGAISWLVYLLTDFLPVEAACYFLATIAVSALAEILARALKAPATIFLVIGIIPLVPGGGLYYTMDYLISGDFAMFTAKGLQTAAAAGAIAAGASMVTSLVRMLTWRKQAHAQS